MATASYKEGLHERLREPKYAAGLLRAAFDESYADGNWEAFGLLLQDIIEANGDKRNFAKKAGISRGHLYRLFGKKANPTLRTIAPVLAQFGVRLTLSAEKEDRKKS
jgi:DNA-binding phage protein